MNDTEGYVDILVCMAGTGGTGFGTASYLRSRNPNLQVVLVQPHPDSRLTPEHPDAQIIDGVLPAYDVPESALSDYLRPDWSDACINVRTEEAYETAHEVLRTEGLFLGTSAAAALHAAVQVGRRPENQGKNIVVIVPDNGYEVAVDLPGCKKEDVQMDLNDGYLTIQAVRSHSNDEKDKNGRYLRRESFSGTCARSFYVGDVKKEDIHAKFEDGVLHVELPAPQQTKALPENPNLIEIE